MSREREALCPYPKWFRFDALRLRKPFVIIDRFTPYFNRLIDFDSSSTLLISWFLFGRPAATSADPKGCSTANLALQQKKRKLFTGFGYQLLLKSGLPQHALYTSSS